jgi:hypothetical protein
MMAVIGATAKLGLMAASKASGATARDQHGKERPLTGMRNEHSYSAPESHSDQRANGIVDRRLDGPANARLCHEGSCEHCPEREAKLQSLCDGK